MTQKKTEQMACVTGVLLMMAYGFIGNTLGFFVLPVTEGLGVTRAAFNLYFTIMSIVGMIAAPVFGQLYRRVRLSCIVLFGLLVGAVSFTAMSFAGNVFVFYIVGILLGLVQQTTTSIAAVVLINRTCGDNAGGPMGVVMAGTGMISLLMSFVLPTFMESFGWRSGYRLQALLWGLFMACAAFLLRKVEAKTGGPKGGEGTGEAGKTAASGKAAAISGGKTLAEALRTVPFYALFACIFINSICSVFIHHMPAYYAERGMDPARAGLIVAFFNLGLIFFKVLSGRMYDRLGHARTALILGASLGAGMLVMSGRSMITVLAGTVLYAFGMPAITVLFPLITRHIFGGRDDAAIWSVMSMAVSFGTALGSPIWGAVYDMAQSYVPGMIVVPVLAIIAAVVLWYLAAHHSADT